MYSVTVIDTGNGTAEATVGDNAVTEAAENTEVTITATPAEGYEFDKWTIVRGVAYVPDMTAMPATFTMPAEDVAIKAEFKPLDIPVGQYTITLVGDGNGTAEATVGGVPVTEAEANAEVTITAAPDGGYDFVKWTIDSGGAELQDKAANPSTFIMPVSNVSVAAEFAPIPPTEYDITVKESHGTVRWP